MKRFRTFTLALASLALVNAAHAIDSKTYPGTSCRPTSSSGGAYGVYGVVSNPSTSPVTFVCPIVRDRMNDGVSSVQVWVQDQHYSSDIVCTVRLIAPGSSIGGFAATASTTGSGSVSELTFAGIAGLFSSISNGRLVLACDVPATYSGNQSKILTYQVNEID